MIRVEACDLTALEYKGKIVQAYVTLTLVVSVGTCSSL